MGALVAASVLVVEDDPEILRMMKQVLSRDFVVHTAASGEEALQLLRTERFHAVVSDHMLPAMTGVDLLRQVAALQPDAARVLVTASSRMDTAQDAVNVAKVKRFLTKPFRTAELIATVGEAIHEAALIQIKAQLVQELKQRNTDLSKAVSSLEARDEGLSRRLEQLALRDTVTGLFTHRFLQETLAAERARAQRTRASFSLVMLDVNDFRGFNREYGFAEGDLLLRRVAGLLSAWELSARYGADRFAVILPGADAAGAEQVAGSIRAAAGVLARDPQSPGPFTLRVAVATWPVDGDDEEAMIAAVQRALAAARSG
jgi:diguanylate cyclase (GGDEF)-like protein